MLTKEEIYERSVPYEWKEPQTGIYFLLEDSEPVYIGKAVNVNKRFGEHTKDKFFNRVTVLPTDDYYLSEQVRNLERDYQNYLHTKYNREPWAGAAAVRGHVLTDDPEKCGYHTHGGSLGVERVRSVVVTAAESSRAVLEAQASVNSEMVRIYEAYLRGDLIYKDKVLRYRKGRPKWSEERRAAARDRIARARIERLQGANR